MDGIDCPSSLEEICFWYFEHNFDKIKDDLCKLPGPLLSRLLSFLMAQRKQGSRTLDDANIHRFFAPSLLELDLESFWITDLPFVRHPLPCTQLVYINLNQCLNIGDGALKAIAHSTASSLKILKAKGSKNITNEGLLAICQNCVQLEIFQIDCLNIKDESFAIFEKCLPNLRQATFVRMVQITSVGLKYIFSSFPLLQKLKMTHCPVNDEDLTSILTEYPRPKIVHLALSEFSKIKKMNFEGFPNLIHLSLNRCSQLHDISSISLCTKLLIVKIIRCERVNNISHFTTFAPQLQILILDGSKKITADSFQKVAAVAQSLQKLSIQGISSLFTQLMQDCRKIFHTHVHLRQSVTSIQDLNLGWTNVQRLIRTVTNPDKSTYNHFLWSQVPYPNLKSLNLTDVPVYKEDRINYYCPNLERLGLEVCPTLKDDILDYLLNGDEIDPGLAHILHLNLTKCLQLKKPTIKHERLQSLFLSWTNITDVEIMCPNLTTLDLSGVTTITEESVKRIIQNSGTYLKHLWLQNSDVMTDELLHLVPVYCKRLQMLNVSSNKVITQSGIEHIVKKCKKLQRIYLNDCQISDWKYLSETYPQVIFTIRKMNS